MKGRHTVTRANKMNHILFRFLFVLLLIHDSFMEVIQLPSQNTVLPSSPFILTEHEFNSLQTIHE